ncbi:MAG: AAA family ATPase [Bacteriovoracaceae bacterium]
MNATQWLASHNRYSEENQRVAPIRNLYSQQAKTIAFTSGKGGVGKTTCSLKFAEQLQDEGYRVLLIDCDFNLSNTGVKLNVFHDKTLIDADLEGEDLESLVYKDWTCDIIFAGNGHSNFYKNEEQSFTNLVLKAIKRFESNYDYIILDCPAGCSKGILSLCAYCDERVVVVTPDKSSLTDSYSIIKLLKTIHGTSRNYLLLNKVQGQRQKEKIENSLINTGKKFLDVELTSIGDVEYLNKSLDMFDQIVFSRKNLSIEKNFQKIVKSFTEEGVAGYVSSLIDTNLAATGSRNSIS